MTRAEALAAFRDAGGWRKATASTDQGECIEVNLAIPSVVGVRDSKLGEQSPVLVTSPTGWSAFLAAVANGEG